MKKIFYVLLEGPDDARFFDLILRPQLLKKYDQIITYLYSGRPQKIRERYVESLNKSDSDYMIISDFDSSTCITFSKDNLKSKISVASTSNIIISKTEIESWYLAGIDFKNSRYLQIPHYATTDDISKKQFDEIMPEIFNSRIDFMQEILKRFDSNIAKAQNSSFRYMWNKFIF